MTPCSNCDTRYNSTLFDSCPSCKIRLSEDPSDRVGTNAIKAKPQLLPKLPENGTLPSSPPPSRPQLTADEIQSWSGAKKNYAELATTSAETIDLYGLVIQIIGWVTAVVYFIYFNVVVMPGSELGFWGVMGGFFITLLIGWSFNVVGALYRMIANYVLFRTSK
jgi:hypothetical protein